MTDLLELLLRVWEVPGPEFELGPDMLTEGSYDFSQSLYAISGIFL